MLIYYHSTVLTQHHLPQENHLQFASANLKIAKLNLTECCELITILRRFQTWKAGCNQQVIFVSYQFSFN